MPPRRPKRMIDEPVMSDATILIRVEDLINNAMGPSDVNTVNFKLLQSVLHILARQLRLMTTLVEIPITESSPYDSAPKKKERKKKGKDAAETKEEKEREMTKSAAEKKEEEALQAMSPAQREKYLEKEKIAAEKKEEALQAMSPAEREKYLEKEKIAADKKEEEALQAMSPAQREKYLKEKKEKIAADKKEEEALQAMSPAQREKYLKEKKEKIAADKKEEEALQAMSPAQREKYLKQKKEKIAADKKEEEALQAMSPAQREKYLKEKKEKQQALGGRGSTTAISGARPRVGSVEVVPRAEFTAIEAAVNALKEKAGPLPMPSLPENDKLRSDLATGTATLTDTMQAMQLSARVMAAEQGLSRMAGLLTQLAAAGALPAEFATQLKELTNEMAAIQGELAEEQVRLPRDPRLKSVAIDSVTVKISETEGVEDAVSSSEGQGPWSIGGVSTASRMSRPSTLRPHTVTQDEMDEALRTMREDLLSNIRKITEKATFSAENAVSSSSGVVEKLDIAVRLNSRLSDIYGQMACYKDQLTGFDAGLTTQMKNFQEQMVQLRGDLSSGMKQFEAANSNAETTAVMELTERYDTLVLDLEETTTKQQHLTSFQQQLSDELNSLVQAVEMMREQKADRDEVVDGLRDKADNSKLDGLLQEKEFALAREELDAKLDWCYDKFKKQEFVWMEALKDLGDAMKTKAEILELYAAKEEAEEALADIKEKLRLLAIQLGEPKAAILTRLLSKDGRCGSCMESALMEALDKDFGKPKALPAFHPPPDDEPCVPIFPIQKPKDDSKVHKCNRWTGGSHTLLQSRKPREVAPATLLAHGTAVKKYTGYGDDGKLYNLEEELQPCVECNRLCKDSDKVKACLCDGTGDAACLCQGIQTDRMKKEKKTSTS